MKNRQSQSPVSHPVNVARLPQKGMPVMIEANPAQRAILADEHGLLGVSAFRADLLVSNWRRNGVKVAGRVEADIEQECVVTLEPLDARISEEFSQVFLPDDSKLGRQGFHEGGEVHLDAEGPDSPEPFSGDVIDVGALAEEFFGLAIDPYPRKPGASLPGPAAVGEEETGGQLREKLSSLNRKS
jgi:hypothetical protein